MSVKIVQFTRKNKRQQYPHDGLADILASEIMREYATYSIDTVGKAIAASNLSISKGGTFVDALEAANRCVQANNAGEREREEARRNFERLLVFRRRQARMAEALLRTSETHIRLYLQHATDEEVQAAIERAWRVLQHGGHIDRAIYLALLDDMPGIA